MTTDRLPCRVWPAGRLGLHAHGLYRLADVLEADSDMPVFERGASGLP